MSRGECTQDSFSQDAKLIKDLVLGDSEVWGNFITQPPEAGEGEEKWGLHVRTNIIGTYYMESQKRLRTPLTTATVDERALGAHIKIPTDALQLRYTDQTAYPRAMASQYTV